VLDNIGCRIFLEQPARKNLSPTLGIVRPSRTFANKQLDKSALIGMVFPRRGFLARPQPDDDLAVADCFAWFKLDIPGLAVSFIKQAENRNPLSHWRAYGLAIGSNNGIVARLCLARFFGSKFLGIVSSAVASGKHRDQSYRQQAAVKDHIPSGLHAL